ncbi:MAG TPA: aspartate/glutamate racemase family protein, partial [Thermomicrobiaceae bacterium]|nr:aspartate/glutamate racemase family protein [Thermomicrobiaceae bacterium]
SARQAAAIMPPGSAVGILATEGTARAGLYQSALQDAGLRGLTPGVAAQGWVSQAIGMVKSGLAGSNATHLVLRAVAELIADGAKALVAACTEIPIILDQSDVEVPLIDPTDILARTAVDWASGQPGLEEFAARTGASADARRD